MTELRKAIVKKVENRAAKIIEDYVAKRGGFEHVMFDSGGRFHSIKFSKFVMVQIEDVWYRCSVTFCYDCNFYGFEEGNGCEVEDEYDCYVSSIINEITKETIN